MKKVKYNTILLSILLKYVLFYVVLMLLNNNTKILEVGNIRSGQDLFYYLWITLFFPILDVIFFSLPIYFSFQLKKPIIFVICIAIILTLEYLVYAFLTNGKPYNRDSLIKILINSLVLVVIFRNNFFYNPDSRK